jgi:hypothetical protein
MPGNWEVERKVNVLSATALLLSLCAVGYQLYGYWQKARVKLLDPEQITFYSVNGQGGHRHLQMATDFVFFNDGQPGYSGLVKAGTLRFTAGDKQRELRWQQFGRWEKDEFNEETPAHPFAVPGAQVIGYEISFAPRSIPSNQLKPNQHAGQNWVDWDEFCNELERLGTVSPKQNFQVECIADLFDGARLTSTVQVSPNASMLRDLRERGWSAPSCWKIH